MAGLGSISVTLGLNVRDFQNGLQTAQTNMQRVADGMRATGEQMASAISVPLAGLGAIAMAGAVQVEKSQSMIQAQLGVTGERASELQGVVNNLFKEGLGGDMSEVQNAVTNVIRNMKELKGASDETVQAVAKNSLNLSKAFEVDTNDISKSINSMQQAFDGLSVEQSFDLITNGFQNGLDYSGEFLDTINEYSTHFKKMGFSAEEMFSFFNAGAEAGVFQLDKVGDLVKEMNIRLSDGTATEYMRELSSETQNLYKEYQKTGKGGQEVFQSVMEDLRQMDNEQEAYTLGVGLMGTQFEDLEMDAVKALGEVMTSTGEATGSMEALNEAMNKDLGTVLSASFRQVTLALQPIGSVMAGLIQEYLPPLIAKVQELGEWFAGLSSKSQLVIVALGALGAVLPVILMFVAGVVSAVGTIAGALSGLMGVGSTIFGIFMKVKNVLNFATLLPLITSPVGLIVLAIGALIAIGVAVWQNWETVKAKASEIWGAITDFFSSTWDSISGGISSFLEKTVKWFSEKWEKIKKVTSDVFNAIVDFFVEWAIKIFTLTPIGKFVNLIISNWELIRDTTLIIFEMIRDIIKAIWNKVVELTKPILSAFIGFVTDIWNKIYSTTKSVFNSVKDFFVNIWNSIVNFVKPIISSISNAISSGWNNVKNTTSTIFNAVKDFLSGVWDSIYSKVSSVVGTIVSTVKTKFTEAKNAITEPIQEAKEKIKGMLDDIKGFFDNLKLKIPMPSLPKISVSAGKAEFLGQEITVPKFDVSWNAKGGIFDGATLLGGGQGVGEAGAEVVMPIQHKRYMQPFSSSIAEHLSKMGNSKASGGITQHITINSPEPLSPSEIARKQLQASRKLAMEWR